MYILLHKNCTKTECTIYNITSLILRTSKVRLNQHLIRYIEAYILSETPLERLTLFLAETREFNEPVFH